MKYFPMIGSIDQAMLERFIEFANNYEQEDWKIVLNTSGGSFFQSEMIINILNNHSNASIVVQGAYSAGFVIIMETICPKILSKTCRGMWHYGKWDLSYNDKAKPYYYEDECIIRNMPFHKKHSEKIAKKIMTPKEYKAFMEDKDVYFDTKRMKQIFPDAETI